MKKYDFTFNALTLYIFVVCISNKEMQVASWKTVNEEIVWRGNLVLTNCLGRFNKWWIKPVFSFVHKVFHLVQHSENTDNKADIFPKSFLF